VMEADRLGDPQLIWRDLRKRAAHSGEPERPRDFLMTASARRRINVRVHRARGFDRWRRLGRVAAASRNGCDERESGKEGGHAPRRWHAQRRLGSRGIEHVRYMP